MLELKDSCALYCKSVCMTTLLYKSMNILLKHIWQTLII